MTAPLISLTSKPQPSSWSSQRATRRSSSHTSSHARSGSDKTSTSDDGSTFSNSSLDALWSTLIETAQEGVLVVAHNLLPVYTNTRATELCQQMLSSDSAFAASLPSVIVEACHRLTRNESVNPEPLIVEYQGNHGHALRLRVCWLRLDSGNPMLNGSNQSYILVRLEDRDALLEEELQLDRQKYDLTEREAEIWMLRRRECTYQEIAELLQISLNTVKTHVKNVYAKRRSSLGQRKIWYSR